MSVRSSTVVGRSASSSGAACDSATESPGSSLGSTSSRGVGRGRGGLGDRLVPPVEDHHRDRGPAGRGGDQRDDRDERPVAPLAAAGPPAGGPEPWDGSIISLARTRRDCVPRCCTAPPMDRPERGRSCHATGYPTRSVGRFVDIHAAFWQVCLGCFG